MSDAPIVIVEDDGQGLMTLRLSRTDFSGSLHIGGDGTRIRAFLDDVELVVEDRRGEPKRVKSSDVLANLESSRQTGKPIVVEGAPIIANFAAHSPGPWRWAVEGHPDDGDQVLVDGHGVVILRAESMGWNRADAALIAAAPELLALLRETAVTLSFIWGLVPDVAVTKETCRTVEKLIEDADALLAKLPEEP